MPAESHPLTQLGVGQIATVTAINLSPDDSRRVQELGLVVGTSIELVRFAPLGDPVEIKVRHYRLTLGKQEAEQILVCPQKAAV